jgi:hypothetical protein
VEVLAGFLLGYILGTEAGAQGVSNLKEAFGTVSTAGEVQSVMSKGMATGQGLLGGFMGGGDSGATLRNAKDAIGTLASNDDVKSMVSAGFSTAQGLVTELVGRASGLVSEQVASQRSRGLRLVV